MVGSSVNMETAASTPSLVLLEELMDSPESGPQLKRYPSSRTSLPNLSPVSPGGNGRSKGPQSLLQDFLRASSRRGSRRRTAEVSETPDPPPVTRRIWCDSEECLTSSPFIKIQQFPQNGQCQNCGQVMKDVATNTEVVQDAKPEGDGVCPQGHVARDAGQSEPSIEEAVPRVVRRPRKNSNLNKVSFDEKSSRRRSLPMAFDWWSDKVLKRQSSNIKDNVLKSWCHDENDPAPYGPRSVSDQAIHKTVVGASRTSVDAIKLDSPKYKARSQLTLSDNGGWFKAKNELKHGSKSTPNLSYPSTQVDKLESARLAAWWEASPYPVRSQRFTFRSHSSGGQKVVLRKGQASFEVSAKGKRRQSTNLADLEDLMGAVSGSEEETETDGEGHTSRAILLPYEALQEEMDARAGNFNHSNSKDQIPAIRIDSTKEHRTPQRPHSLFHDRLTPKTPETLSRSTPYINGSGPVSSEWSFSSPSLESVIQSQFLRNTSLSSLQHEQKHHHKSFLPGEGLGTPKRLQGGRRSGTKGKELLRHSWAGRPNPLSTSLLKLVKSERSSWIGAANELPVIPEDRGKERVKEQHRSFIRLQGSTASFLGSAVQCHGATSGLCSEEPQLDPDEADHHLRSLDTKHPHLLTGEFLVKKNIRSKPPFKRRVSPPTSYFNPWVLQPQQLRQKLESLQDEQGGNDHRRNGTQKPMKPELIVVDIFDDSKEVSCGDQDCKMPQDSIMEEPINESVSNLDATEDVSRDPEGDTTLGQSGNSPPRFVRSVSNGPSRNREVFVDSQSGSSGRTEKHARTTNNNRRSLSPQAREYVSRLDPSGRRHSGSLAASGENEDHQMNGYRQRKKSLALAMNEGRLEMKEVCMRPLDVDLDFHLIAQLNQLNRELMDLSKSGSSTSPSSPGVGANHSFSLLENNGEILVDGEDKHNLSSSPQSPISLQVPQTRHSQGNDVYSPISSKRGKSPVEAKQKKSSHETPRRRQSDESVSPVVSSKKSSPEQKTIVENSKESKSVSPREVISRIKLRFSNSKLTRGSPQRSSAGKIEIQILRPNLDNPENEPGTAFKRSASLRHDSDSRKTWPNLEASTEGYEESHKSPSPVYRRCESDGPVERQRKKPLLPDSNPMLEQNHNAPGSSTDSGLGKDQRHSKSSADSLLEDFHVSSQVSSSCNSNPPSRPLSSDIGDLSWEKGRELLPSRFRGIPGYLSSSTPHSPNLLTPTTGSREDLLDGQFSRPESQEDLLGGRGNGMRASGSSQGSSISHAAMQSGIKPPKPRHKPLRRSKTDLGDPSIIKAALTLAKMQGDEAPKVVEGTSKPLTVVRKRPTSALGIMGILNSSSGRESPIRQLTQSDGKPSPRLQRSQRQPAPDPLSLVVDGDAEQNDKTMNDLPLTPLTPKPRSRSLGSLGTFEIPDMTLMKRAHSLPAGLGDDELMMSDPDLSKINARMSETFEQFCAATLAEALFDHVTMDGHELTFQAGDMIEITDMTDAYWWWGCIDKQEGWLPAPFVRLKVSQGETVEECMSRLQDNTSLHQQGLGPSHQPLIRKVSLSFLSNDQVRANVIREIITTERDYVKNLADIYEGYIEQARSRPDMFNQTLMSKLFCNIEEIYCFQQRFLADLETCIDKEMPNLSAIGDCFLKYKSTFDIYGEYCNNYPHAMNEFQTLMRDNKYVQFFEACRLLQSMIKIQLDGFLLTPVQKICKYPLQLNELLKYTRPQHPDYQPLKSALEAMREVAQSINERKRRIEHIENIALWQKTIGDWEGDDVLDRSSMLIYSNEVNRVSLAGRHRTSPRQLFLFDHQLIICRKDILRRDLYVYKDRIDLDDCQIEDLPDGKENEWNVTLRYAWKIQNFEDQSKVYLFMCRSRKEKKRWLRHFAKERKIVHEGLTRGSSFMAAKEAALKTTSSRDKPSKPSDRGVTVRRALSMPHRKVRDPSAKEPALQLPGAPSPEVELDASTGTPKKKGLSLFGVQFGKK